MPTIFDIAKNAIAAFFMETDYVSRVYADPLRDNLVGYEPIDRPKFARRSTAKPLLGTLLPVRRFELWLSRQEPDCRF